VCAIPLLGLDWDMGMGRYEKDFHEVEERDVEVGPGARAKCDGDDVG